MTIRPNLNIIIPIWGERLNHFVKDTRVRIAATGFVLVAGATLAADSIHPFAILKSYQTIENEVRKSTKSDFKESTFLANQQTLDSFSAKNKDTIIEQGTKVKDIPVPENVAQAGDYIKSYQSAHNLFLNKEMPHVITRAFGAILGVTATAGGLFSGVVVPLHESIKRKKAIKLNARKA